MKIKMKNLRLITLGIMLFFASSTIHSQVSVSVNLGVQPSWGPVGYSSVDYYYLPDIQTYYDIRASQFMYISGGIWIRSRYLPRQYRDYDLDRGYKVVLNDYHGSRPYTQFRYHKEKYYKGYNKPQKSIGYKDYNKRNDEKHDKYEKYENNSHDNDRNEGHGNKNRGHKK